MFDKAYELIAKGQTHDAIDSVMDKFDNAYCEGRFEDAAKELMAADLSRLDNSTIVTVAVVSWWGRNKTGCHAIMIEKIEKKLRETMNKKKVNRCLDGLR